MLKSPEHRQYRGHSLLGTGTSLCPSLPRTEPPWLLIEARGTFIPNPCPTRPRTGAPVMTSGLPPRPHSDGGCPDSAPRPWTSPPQGVTGRKSRAHPPPPPARQSLCSPDPMGCHSRSPVPHVGSHSKSRPAGGQTGRGSEVRG